MKLNNKIKKILKEYRTDRLAIIGIILLLMIIFFYKYILSAIIASILIGLAIIAPGYKRFIPMQSMGFELNTFTFIMFCFAYNPVIAWITVFLTEPIGSLYFSGKFSPVATLIKGIVNAVLIIAFPFLAPLGLVKAGIIMGVFWSLSTRFISIFFGLDPVSLVLSLFGGIATTCFFLIKFGELLLRFM